MFLIYFYCNQPINKNNIKYLSEFNWKKFDKVEISEEQVSINLLNKSKNTVIFTVFNICRLTLKCVQILQKDSQMQNENSQTETTCQNNRKSIKIFD